MPGSSERESFDLHDEVKSALAVGFHVGSGQASREKWLYFVIAFLVAAVIVLSAAYLDMRDQMNKNTRWVLWLSGYHEGEPKIEKPSTGEEEAGQ